MSYKEERFETTDEIDEIGAEGWLFSYSDMMTLLFGFFVMLYALAMENQGQIDQKLKEMSPLAFREGSREAIRPADEKNPLFVEMEKRLKEQTDKLKELDQLHERVLSELKTSDDKVQALTLALNELQLEKARQETKEKQSAVRAVREQDIQQLNQSLALATAEKLKLLSEKHKAEDQISALNRNLLDIQREKLEVVNENETKTKEIGKLGFEIGQLKDEKNSLVTVLKEKDEKLAKIIADYYISKNERERIRGEKVHSDRLFEKMRKENETLMAKMKRLEDIKFELEQSLIALELEKKNRLKSKKSPASEPSN